MGLDSSIYSQEISKGDEQTFNKLIGKEEHSTEVLYWRKVYDIVDYFGDILRVEIENCESYELSEADLQGLLEALEERTINYGEYEDVETDILEDIKILKKVLKETDFSKTKFHFYNWW